MASRDLAGEPKRDPVHLLRTLFIRLGVLPFFLFAILLGAILYVIAGVASDANFKAERQADELVFPSGRRGEVKAFHNHH